MGKVLVLTKMTNAYDLANVRRGAMIAKNVKSIEVQGIIDTGAVMLSLPKDLVEQLNLDILEQRSVRYADGRIDTKQIAGMIHLEIQGRQSEVPCIVQDVGAPVLIGQIPLEAMDWNVDLQRRCLIPAHEGYHQGLIEMY